MMKNKKGSFMQGQELLQFHYLNSLSSGLMGVEALYLKAMLWDRIFLFNGKGKQDGPVSWHLFTSQPDLRVNLHNISNCSLT